VTVKDLKVEGALTLLLKDAIKPNLVQTLENTPALIHGGPFANIAHGCNSIIATKMAAKLADYVVTEAGFGVDLGAEKFLNIKARFADFKPSLVVIVATIKALKMHGGVGKDDLKKENLVAQQRGMDNLLKHIETIKAFGLPYVISLNRFITDTDAEIELLQKLCKEHGSEVVLTEVWAKGGAGAEVLAKKVVSLIGEKENNFDYLYPLNSSIQEKIEIIAKKVYGARIVDYSTKAQKQIEQFEKYGWGQLPICMAKTQSSLSDDPLKLGRPEGFTITIRELRPAIGAGFIVALAGDVMTMPGLPKKPAALLMDVSEDGKAIGLF